MDTITPKALFERAQTGPIDVIDVRTPAEYDEVHAALARLTPLDSLNPEAIHRDRNPEEPLYVFCKSGNRARMACEKFVKAGFPNVVVVDGGVTAWAEAGLPVVRGERKVISLERQVRIAAGALVVLGVALGLTVHIAFVGLAAFVGAGLVFAGVTDTCGMAMVLAKMPWNGARGCSGGSCTTAR